MPVTLWSVRATWRGGRKVSLRATEALAAVPMFAGLPADEQQRLAGLLHARSYDRGEVIFLEGDEGAALCVIAEGKVRIQLSGTDGREVVLNVYGPGEIFGELALLDGEPRSADAIAQETTRVFWLLRDDFVRFLNSQPGAAMTMLASLSSRLRHTTRVVQDATFRDVPSRLARLLLELAARDGRAVPKGIQVMSRQTQVELAAMIGASRETVNRALRRFKQLGLIDWEAGYVVIVQPERLDAWATGDR